MTVFATTYIHIYKRKGKGQTRTGHEGPEGEQMYSSTLPSTSALDGEWSAPRPGRFTPAKDPVPIVQEAGWAPGPVWTGAENLAPTGIRSPDRPAGSESLYRLSYRGPCMYIYICVCVCVCVCFVSPDVSEERYAWNYDLPKRLETQRHSITSQKTRITNASKAEFQIKAICYSETLKLR